MTTQIDGYLTEAKLAIALQQIVGSQWVGTQWKLPDSKYRWDAAFDWEGSRILVEFDGDAHYRDSLKIKVDGVKDSLAYTNNCRVVRIPYWVQLDSAMVLHYFGFDENICQNFQHGFITSKIFPASFCELGILRFQRELESLPDTVRGAVVQSLRDRAEEHGIEFVLPQSLRHLMNG